MRNFVRPAREYSLITTGTRKPQSSPFGATRQPGRFRVAGFECPCSAWQGRTAPLALPLLALLAARCFGLTVMGTGDPKVDVPAVQAAVVQGGRVVLKGNFSFDVPPRIPEQPSHLFSGPALGTVLVSRAAEISGEPDGEGRMATITGGINPFYVEAPGAAIAIRGLHFIHSKAVAIRVVAAMGLTIVDNRIEGMAKDADAAMGIAVTTSPGTPKAGGGKPENVSGTLSIASNDIDMQGTAGSTLGIAVFAVGRSPDKEADLYISENNIRNVTERPIDIYSVGGRAHVERNVIATGSTGVNVRPSGDAIHIVGPGSFLIAYNTIDCAWATGSQAGIRLMTRPGQPVSHAVVVGNDVNMSAPAGSLFGATSAAIEIRNAGEGNMVLGNRIRGRARFALSIAGQTGPGKDGVPSNTSFLMNDLTDFQAAQVEVFVEAGAVNTIITGRQTRIEDHGAGTVVVLAAHADGSSIAPSENQDGR